ncbi:MAG: hypothetical protein EZS28_018887 [Streblomastix strix]|uniref:Uncharacterized protein n=1 Tax=Streblomastix strix TaxID=222440 RepID=A0A5J4VSN0_9EUKA|nr:MAG: hypothetical protein EZS28_018887 [Streblomastix strix]
MQTIKNALAVQAIFEKGKQAVTEKFLNTFELLGEATTQAQQLRNQNIGYKIDRFSYRNQPSTAALSLNDKKIMKEDRSISQHRRRGRDRSFSRSWGLSRRRGSYRRGKNKKKQFSLAAAVQNAAFVVQCT